MGLIRFDNRIKKLEKFLLDVEGLVMDEASTQMKQMEDLNREQLAEGTEHTGLKIRPAYRPKTVAIKNRQGKPSDRVTLFDTGEMYSRLQARKVGKKITLQSTDPKVPQLKEKYGNRIFGLNSENLAIISQKMLPGMTKRSRKYFGI